MLICSCNLVSKAEIEAVIDGFLAGDPWLLITPSRVYAQMARRGRCCGCFPNVVSIIYARVQAHHAGLDTPQRVLVPFLQRLQHVATSEISPHKVVLPNAVA